MSNKKSRYSSLKEAIWGVPAPVEIEESAGEVIAPSKQSYVNALTDSFTDQLKVFRTEPLLFESINQMAQEVVGPGFFTSASKDYTLVLEGKTAKDIIDEWCQQNDIDNKSLQIATETLAFGNSFWYLKNGFHNIKIDAVRGVAASKTDVPIGTEYDLELTGVYNSKTIKSGQFIHFRYNLYGDPAPLGVGIIQVLIASPNENSSNPSLFDLHNDLKKYMLIGFKKFSFPNSYLNFPKVSDGKLSEIQTKLNGLSDTGNRFGLNVDNFEIKTESPGRAQGYENWMKDIDSEYIMALGGNPSLKMGLGEMYTKASSETGRTYFESKITCVRRIIKRVFEDLWVKILQKEGYDGFKAQVKMNFGSQDIDYKVTDLFSAVDKSIITKEEARRILRENMKWKIEETLPAVEPAKSSVPIAEFKTLQESVNSLKNEKSKLKEESIKKKIQVYDKLLADGKQ
jgi:hypothetical protein